jgi:hypothetical protein
MSWTQKSSKERTKWNPSARFTGHQADENRRPPAIRPWTQIWKISPGSPATEPIMTEAVTRKPSVHRPPHTPATAVDVMRAAPATLEPTRRRMICQQAGGYATGGAARDGASS